VVADEHAFRPPGLTRIDGNHLKGDTMGNKADRTKGAAKRAAGTVTGDDALKEQGRRDQAKGNVKAGAKKAKEAVKKL
jgi:uncharacterized protein YjbJ (UPF0337 family)